MIHHIFFDIGGVLGTNGWDQEQRARGIRKFGLDAEDFEQRHQAVTSIWESGGMGLDEYLDCTVFCVGRAFTREEFKAFMLAQSVPFPDSIEVVRELAATKRYSLMAINNESAELNVHRLRRFGLVPLFSAFFSSCWMGMLKPSRRIFEIALAISQAEPDRSLFIDDRAQNLAPAEALGLRTVLFTDAVRLRAELASLGVFDASN